MVYELGAGAWVCAVCCLSDCARHRIIDAANSRDHVNQLTMGTDVMLPDLQSAVLCEDVRCEINGMQTLVGVLSVIPAPALPISYIRLCIWTRWCSGAGKFRQKSRIVGVDEQQVIAQAEVEFILKEMEGHATNVHYFGGVQFQQYGLHHVEIYLENELRMRFPLPVIQVTRQTG
jgi:Family of unknown function (DUF6941)